MTSGENDIPGLPDIEGLGEIDSIGVQSHMVFIAHLAQGFDARQSIYLTACTLTGNPGYPPPGTQQPQTD